MVEKKRQHYVPNSYLAAWCDPVTPAGWTPFVWAFAKDSTEGKRKAPAKLFVESEMYTIRLPNGGRDLRLENGLGGLEQAFARIRRDVLDRRAELRGDEQRMLLCMFVAAMHSRTPKYREHWQRQLGEAVRIGESLESAMLAKSPQERRGSVIAPASTENSVSLEELRAVADEPIQHLLLTSIETMAPILFEMNALVVCTTDSPGFITSDSPCMVTDATKFERPFPYNAVGLTYETAEVILPLSPQQTVVFSWKGTKGYQDAPAWVVDELNRQTRMMTRKTFVVSRDVTRPRWFEFGPPRIYDENGVKIQRESFSAAQTAIARTPTPNRETPTTNRAQRD